MSRPRVCRWLRRRSIALPIGLLVGHTGRGAFIVSSAANLGRALPSFALLLMLIPIAVDLRLDFSTWPILGAMVLLAIPPMITNAHAGMREVDPDLVEAARGMGMSGPQVLLRVELPLALPVILTGTRLAAVQVVATYTLGAVAGGGGLGRYIYDGFATQDTAQDGGRGHAGRASLDRHRRGVRASRPGDRAARCDPGAAADRAAPGRLARRLNDPSTRRPLGSRGGPPGVRA